MRFAPLLLPKALERVDRYEKTTIMDLGSPSPETVSYYNRFRCQVYFADLVEQAAGETFEEPELDIPDGVRFDICLFWDTLSYLDAPILRKVAAKLATHIDTETRGHGFVAFSPASSFSCCRFRIEDTQCLLAEPDPAAASRGHTWKDIQDAMWPWVCGATSLMQGNRQELLLTKEQY